MSQSSRNRRIKIKTEPIFKLPGSKTKQKQPRSRNAIQAVGRSKSIFKPPTKSVTFTAEEKEISLHCSIAEHTFILRALQNSFLLEPSFSGEQGWKVLWGEVQEKDILKMWDAEDLKNHLIELIADLKANIHMTGVKRYRIKSKESKEKNNKEISADIKIWHQLLSEIIDAAKPPYLLARNKDAEKQDEVPDLTERKQVPRPKRAFPTLVEDETPVKVKKEPSPTPPAGNINVGPGSSPICRDKTENVTLEDLWIQTLYRAFKKPTWLIELEKKGVKTVGDLGGWGINKSVFHARIQEKLERTAGRAKAMVEVRHIRLEDLEAAMDPSARMSFVKLQTPLEEQSRAMAGERYFPTPESLQPEAGIFGSPTASPSLGKPALKRSRDAYEHPNAVDAHHSPTSKRTKTQAYMNTTRDPMDPTADDTTLLGDLSPLLPPQPFIQKQFLRASQNNRGGSSTISLTAFEQILKDQLAPFQVLLNKDNSEVISHIRRLGSEVEVVSSGIREMMYDGVTVRHEDELG